MKDSYRNPFSGVSAANLDDQSILNYWCSPFAYRLFSEIKETDIYEDPNNIVLMGGRNTGKTMFLRYWSFPVQLMLASQNKDSKDRKIIDYFKDKKGIGFYIRIDGPILRSFNGSGIDSEKWNYIFTHYLELIVGRNYIEAIKKFYDLDELKKDEIENHFIPEVKTILNAPQVVSLDDLLSEFDNRIKEVDTFRGNIPFVKNDFVPSKRGFASQSLSFGIPKIAKNTISAFKDSINFILLIDEYENYLEPQQRMINTLLRFSKNEIRFRIGMRLEGFRTFSMISEDDFIKEGREYRKVIFEEVLIKKDTDYRDFLKEVSKKRLESVKIFKENGKLDITEFLSKSEELEEEALELVAKNPEKHFSHFKKSLKDSDINTIKYKENPLLELLNILWLSRGVPANEIKTAMEDYLKGNKIGEKVKKYHMDYVNKYKLSLMFLLCSIYRKHKKYYSFNTFTFLSSGIVGNFIELCRRSFQYAEFENKELLIKEGKISKEQQTKAALDFSESELQQINRIESYGGFIHKFINNVGNIFRDFHKDEKIRYPETNQFSADIDSLSEQKFKDAFKAAIKWSVVQKKPKIQQPSPGKHLKDIYTINRIYAPSFQISCRTRGGYSVKLTALDIEKFMTEENVSSTNYLKQISDESESLPWFGRI